MKFSVKQSELVEAMGVVSGVAERKAAIPVLGNVKIKTEGAKLALTCTDLALTISAECGAEIQKPGEVTLPAKRLSDFIRLLPAEDIAFSVSENHAATIMCGRSKTRISGMSAEGFPATPEPGPAVVTMPARQLADILSRAVIAISTEGSRYTLDGAKVILNGGNGAVQAADGHRLAVVSFPCEATRLVHFLLNRSAARDVIRLVRLDPDAVAEITTDDDNVFFRIGTRLIVARKLSGQFPDTDRVLKSLDGEDYKAIQIDRAAMIESCKRVIQFADARSRAMKLVLKGSELTVMASVDGSDSVETLDVQGAEEDAALEIGFNCKYILEFLEATPADLVMLRFKDGSSAGEFRPVSDKQPDSGFRYVLMPMRM